MKLAAVGKPLVDLFAPVAVGFVSELGFVEGSINHIERSEMDRILPFLAGAGMTAAGCGASVCRIASLLGAETLFCGAVGDDDLGRWYRRQLADAGVDTALASIGKGTGVFCALRNPDGVRTLIVSGGASESLDDTMIPDAVFLAQSVVFIEGYLACVPDTLLACVRRAVRAGARCVLDLGHPVLAAGERPLFEQAIAGGCDMVFGNEEEFLAFSGCGSVPDGLAHVPRNCDYVIKRGAAGACSFVAGRYAERPAIPVRCIDETGAGDAFDAAYLVALHGSPDQGDLLAFANRVASRVVEVPGMRIDPAVIRGIAADYLPGART